MALIVNLVGPKGDQGDKGDKGDPLSVAPTGHFKVTNIYVNSQTGKLVIEYDDTPSE